MDRKIERQIKAMKNSPGKKRGRLPNPRGDLTLSRMLSNGMIFQ